MPKGKYYEYQIKRSALDQDYLSGNIDDFQYARESLELDLEYEPTFKDAVMAMRVLQKTINIRTQTEEDFDVSEDDIKHCHFAIECILEDINYDCYLEDN